MCSGKILCVGLGLKFVGVAAVVEYDIGECGMVGTRA